jgi:DNA-binding transcriptional ArsR family regulator
MGISQSALSQHLAVLRAADIVSTRRIAQSVYYSLTNPKCIKILDLLKNIYY